MHMKNHHFSKTKPPLFLLLGFIVSSLICCGVPVPREYRWKVNQEKLDKFAVEDTIDLLQCDGIAKFELIIGPKEECFINYTFISCPVLVKRERYLSDGTLDDNPAHVFLDTLSPNLDTNHTITTLYLTSPQPGSTYDQAYLGSLSEYFKITIFCVDQLDGICAPRMRIRRR